MKRARAAVASIWRECVKQAQRSRGRGKAKGGTRGGRALRDHQGNLPPCSPSLLLLFHFVRPPTRRDVGDMAGEECGLAGCPYTPIEPPRVSLLPKGCAGVWARSTSRAANWDGHAVWPLTTGGGGIQLLFFFVMCCVHFGCVCQDASVSGASDGLSPRHHFGF